MPEEHAGNRVLLIEEDDLQRQMIREYLQFMGPYEVLEPGGPYHLLAFCENPMQGTLLVLLDMEWSRVDGVELVAEIRKRNPILPILGMTDKQADLYCDPRLIGQPMIGLIPKPFSPYHLHRSIKAVLRAHREGLPKPRAGQGILKVGSGRCRPIQIGRTDYAQNPL